MRCARSLAGCAATLTVAACAPESGMRVTPPDVVHAKDTPVPRAALVKLGPEAPDWPTPLPEGEAEVIRILDIEMADVLWESGPIGSPYPKGAGDFLRMDLERRSLVVRNRQLPTGGGSWTFVLPEAAPLPGQAVTERYGGDGAEWTRDSTYGKLIGPGGVSLDIAGFSQVTFGESWLVHSWGETDGCCRLIRRSKATGEISWSVLVSDVFPGSKDEFVTLDSHKDVIAVVQSPMVACLDAATGAVLWRTDVAGALPNYQLGGPRLLQDFGVAQVTESGVFCVALMFAVQLHAEDGSVSFWIEYPKWTPVHPLVTGRGPVAIIMPASARIHRGAPTVEELAHNRDR